MKTIFLIFIFFISYRLNGQNKIHLVKPILDSIKEQFYNFYSVYDTVDFVLFKDEIKKDENGAVYSVYQHNLIEAIYSHDAPIINFLSNRYYNYIFKNSHYFKDSLLIYLKDTSICWNYKYAILVLLQGQCIHEIVNLINIIFEQVKYYDKLENKRKLFIHYNVKTKEYIEFEIHNHVLYSLIEQFWLSNEIEKCYQNQKLIEALNKIRKYYDKTREECDWYRSYFDKKYSDLAIGRIIVNNNRNYFFKGKKCNCTN